MVPVGAKEQAVTGMDGANAGDDVFYGEKLAGLYWGKMNDSCWAAASRKALLIEGGSVGEKVFGGVHMGAGVGVESEGGGVPAVLLYGLGGCDGDATEIVGNRQTEIDDATLPGLG